MATTHGRFPSFLAAVAQLPLRSRCRDRVNILQLAGGQSWADGGREGKGGPCPFSFSLGQGPFESTDAEVNEMCRTVTSETRRWRVSAR